MVTKLLTLYCGAHLVEFYCKESNIDANWLRYLSSSYLITIWSSVWRHQLANLHILKTWISLEWKEIFEDSKEHFCHSTTLIALFIVWYSFPFLSFMGMSWVNFRMKEHCVIIDKAKSNGTIIQFVFIKWCGVYSN